jgi:stigma-specific protein Stig1
MERLDEFSKLLAASVSRRESLRTIGAVLAGTLFGSWGASTAWAARPDRCGAFCRWCPSKTQRNQCLAACRSVNGNTSRLCGSCGNYSVCPTGTACCSGTCTSVNSDPNNCGACGNICPAAAPSCNQGVCTASACAAGLTSCGGVCVDTDEDSQNCGACGNVCPTSAPFCNQGVCAVNECAPGLTSCGGICTNTDFDNANCGACGVVCGPGYSCQGYCKPIQ